MRLLITGGTGFLGRHVSTAAAARGHDVSVLRRGASGTPDPAATTIEHDLRQAKGLDGKIAGHDCVVHCAASLGGGTAEQQADTIDATGNLLGAMESAGLSRIIGVGSYAVYDHTRLAPGALLDEGAPLVPQGGGGAPYIDAKLEQERLIREHALRNRWAWSVVRPALVYGPGRTWFHHLGVRLSPTRWLCFAPASALPLVHVRDCATAIVLAAETATAEGGTVNLVASDLPARGEYIRALAGLTSPRAAVYGVPWGLLSGAASVADGVDRRVARGRLPLPDLLRPASLHARSKPLQYTNALARRSLGWSPAQRWESALADALTAPAGG